MPDGAHLAGHTVLVVEDDYFIATDIGRSLRRAGGCVLGPVGHEDQALDLIRSEPATCAVVDINLGEGPSFAVSEALQDAGIPFVFVTGYDDVVTPARFDGVTRLRKPVGFEEVVCAASRLGVG